MLVSKILLNTINIFLMAITFYCYSKPASAQNNFREINYYKTEYLGHLKNDFGEPLIIQRAWTDTHDVPTKGTIERIQIMDPNGKIIAYTPTRITAIPFCNSINYCWVFMWKTVYPMPAIYKLDPEPVNWHVGKNPPLQYSRYGPNFKGFKDHTNLIFGTLGIFLIFLKFYWFFAISILFSILMCMQMSAYHGATEDMKKIVRIIITILTSKISFGFFYINPYVITAFILFIWMSYGSAVIGVPLVLSAVVVMVTFFISALRMGKAKLNKNNKIHE